MNVRTTQTGRTWQTRGDTPGPVRDAGTRRPLREGVEPDPPPPITHGFPLEIKHAGVKGNMSTLEDENTGNGFMTCVQGRLLSRARCQPKDTDKFPQS